VQGYLNHEIYWNGLRKISTYYEQEKDKRDLIAVFLFLDKKHDPGLPKLLKTMSPNQITRAYLNEAIRGVKDNPGALTILNPLILEDKSSLDETVKECVENINKLQLLQDKRTLLFELLNYAILERFFRFNVKGGTKNVTTNAIRTNSRW
jgi:hypothetical protein